MLGSDRPFLPELHAIRPHPGQAVSAANLHRLLQGSAIMELPPRRPGARGAGRVLHAVRPAGGRRGPGHAWRSRPRWPGANWCRLWTTRWCCRTAGCCRPATSTAPRSASPPTSWPSPRPRSARSPNAGSTGCSTCAGPGTCRPFLTPDPGVNSGLMIAQYTAAGIVAENRRLASPASVDSVPTSGMQEDHVSMGWAATRKLRLVLDNLDQPARGRAARRGPRPATTRAPRALPRRADRGGAGGVLRRRPRA